ncbi:MAG TPA: guanylate kinase [Acetobacteraceae bacterium]|jgi:guanylate kinase|nr:guanylate kinase [Acetobacteraceae bacterium]
MTVRSLQRRGLCLVLASPSGGGKSSIARALVADDPGLTLSISVTTRAARPAEREGVDYYFRSREEFDAMAAHGTLLEWAEVFGRGYGTLRAPVEQALSAGGDLVFDIDWQGFRQLRDALPGDVVGVFILPPSLAELRARLVGRASDDGGEIVRRMEAARAEIAHAGEFDHLIVNYDLAASVATARAILQAARTITERLVGLPSYLDAIERES